MKFKILFFCRPPLLSVMQQEQKNFQGWAEYLSALGRDSAADENIFVIPKKWNLPLVKKILDTPLNILKV